MFPDLTNISIDLPIEFRYSDIYSLVYFSSTVFLAQIASICAIPPSGWTDYDSIFSAYI